VTGRIIMQGSLDRSDRVRVCRAVVLRSFGTLMKLIYQELRSAL
jgi:hypothetical protein